MKTGYKPPRNERHEDGKWCDKAWHLDKGEKVPAVAVLRCAICGRIYARCAECNRGLTSAATSMRCHMRSCYQRRNRRRDIYGGGGQ